MNDPQIDVTLPKVSAISSVFVTAECPECSHPRDILHDTLIEKQLDLLQKRVSNGGIYPAIL